MIKRIFIILICVLVMLATSVSAETAVKSIRISLQKSEINVGDYERISTSVMPFNAEDYELTYTSDNPDVCIAAIGAVIAVSEGTATITVKVAGTDISDSVTVTVKNPETEPEEEVKLNKIIPNKTSVYIERYDNYQIKYSIEPKECTEKITYESMNTSIATVDENGLVYAKKTGNTKIKLSSEDKTVTAYVNIYVIADEVVEDDDSSIRRLYITLDNEDADSKMELMKTKTLKLGIRTVPEKGNKNVKWRSSDTRIAKVSEDGVVTAVKEGECKIYATSKSDSSVSDIINLTVVEYKKYPERITIEPLDKTEFETDKLIKFNAAIYPEDTTEREVKWYVYGGNANIDQNGYVRINDAGEITVRAYGADYKVSAEYKFTAKYSNSYFEKIGQAYNIPKSREIVITFDSDVNQSGLYQNIFATDDEAGNGEKIKLNIGVEGNTVRVLGADEWKSGKHYLFIKKSLYDRFGNQLGKNIKYEFNVR